MEMKEKGWLLGLLTIVLTFVLSINYFSNPEPPAKEDAWVNMPVRAAHEDHKDLMPGPYQTGQEVTAACVECHKQAGEQVMHTTHWKLESEPVNLPGRDEPVLIGKKSTLNNFCIGIQGEWSTCTACHSGYGWEDDDFDLSDTSNVDCLACHERTGTYKKGEKGQAVEGVNLTVIAQSVAVPGNENCSGCHYRGGDGITVKHGEVDESLFFTSEGADIHTGDHEMLCVDCHRSNLMTASLTKDSHTNDRRIDDCTDCHNNKLHQDDRLNKHTDSVACQTCHIPVVEPTKSYWTWSEDSYPPEEDDDEEAESGESTKIEGSFVYERNRIPEYRWYNGKSQRYILGDEIDPDKPIYIEKPLGDIYDPLAKIWPFKIHVAKQPYDTFMNILLPPKLIGEGEFDWLKALELGAEMANLEFSGEFGFKDTMMYWPATHQVTSKQQALQCRTCHSENGRMDWEALGYPGDPLRWGTEVRNFVLKNGDNKLDDEKDIQSQGGTE